MSKGKGKGEGIATLILILAVAIIMSGVFLSKELNELSRWLFH